MAARSQQYRPAVPRPDLESSRTPIYASPLSPSPTLLISDVLVGVKRCSRPSPIDRNGRSLSSSSSSSCRHVP
jgi:hypothetical protein